MNNWIELEGKFFQPDNEIDFEALGLPEKDTDVFFQRCMVNINHITNFNESSIEGECAVEFINGERWTYKIKFDELKRKIQQL